VPWPARRGHASWHRLHDAGGRPHAARGGEGGDPTRAATTDARPQTPKLHDAAMAILRVAATLT